MNPKINKNDLIIYLFKKGRAERLENTKNYPSEFFYGFLELQNEGFNIKLLEEKDLNIQIKNYFSKKILNLISKLFFDLPFNSILGFIFNNCVKKIKHAKYIIATTNSLGISLSFAKSIGLIKSDIIFINMGLFPKKPNKLKVIFYKYLFKKVKLLTISKTENKYLKSYLKNLDIKYVPFGVDASFWYPQKKLKSEKYVLAIGNDLARDWAILVSAWDDDFPMLKIVTSLPIKNKKPNITVVKGNWHTQALTDLQIRDLYCNSEFIILPLKETFQPSGQSACLQAMSCSKAVLISNIKGIWDRKLLKQKENILFTKTNNVSEMRKSIHLLFNDLKLRDKIGKNGRKLIINHFNIIHMKNKLLESFEDQ
tara:strand:- start:14364 stop:15467 length:1104 start_codon:yes stop_codon:yes gene_type:complete